MVVRVTPARKDLGRIPRWARSDTPSLILTDGRADCLRFASPAEATWRLETWKSMRIDEKTLKILHWRPGTRVSGAVL